MEEAEIQNNGMLCMPIQVMKILLCVKLKSRAEHHNLEDKIGEIIVPTEEVVEMRADKNAKAHENFFQAMY